MGYFCMRNFPQGEHMPHTLRVFVGFTYTHSPESFHKQIEELKKRLAEEGYEIIDLLGLSTESIYDRDIEYTVGECDLFIAMCDYYATTLGIQIGAAAWSYKRQTLLLAHTKMTVAPLLLEMPHKHPFIEFHRYDNIDEINEMVTRIATAMHECSIVS